MRTRVPIWVLCLAACGSPSATDDDSAPTDSAGHEEPMTAPRATPEAPIAPVPFSAARLREATPAGRTYVFRFREGERTRYERWVFETVSEDGWTSTSTPVDEDGAAVGEPERSEGTWDELESHAHFPADQTEVSLARLTIPAGDFRCQLYVVTDERGTSRFWFADELPGAPVRMVRESGGETEVEMLLQSHEAP